MFDSVKRAAQMLREALASLEPAPLSGAEAAAVVDLFSEAERLAAVGRTLAARRVAETELWRREGHRSAGHWMAARTGIAVGTAVAALETARRLDELPAAAEAFRSGRLSEVQAQEIASAAGAPTRLPSRRCSQRPRAREWRAFGSGAAPCGPRWPRTKSPGTGPSTAAGGSGIGAKPMAPSAWTCGRRQKQEPPSSPPWSRTAAGSWPWLGPPVTGSPPSLRRRRPGSRLPQRWEWCGPGGGTRAGGPHRPGARPR